jgi:hypothetical protein
MRERKKYDQDPTDPGASYKMLFPREKKDMSQTEVWAWETLIATGALPGRDPAYGRITLEQDAAMTNKPRRRRKEDPSRNIRQGSLRFRRH